MYLTQGKNCKAAASPRAWKHSRDNVATLTLCTCQQQGVNIHNTFYSSLLLQETGNSHSACSLYPVSPQPMPEQGTAMTLTRFSPTNRHPPVTLEALFGIFKPVRHKAHQSTSNGTTKMESPLCCCALGTERTGWVQALTVRFFCVELDWGFRSFRGCHSSISIIFLLISCSLKYNPVYSYSRHMNSEQFV